MRTKIAIFCVFIVLVLAGLCRATNVDPREFQSWEPVEMAITPNGLIAVTIVNPDKDDPIKAAMLIVHPESNAILIYATFDGFNVRRFVLNDQGKYEEMPMDEQATTIVRQHFLQYVKCGKEA